MKKHAYLIMAHNQFALLEKLLKILDDSRNDIYLHIDKKVKDFDFSHFQNVCRNAGVFFPGKRINIQWGTQSQIKTELLLFQTAYENGPYHYYHVMSGVDLPLLSQDAIHEYFEKKSWSILPHSQTPSVHDCRRISRYHNVFPKWVLGSTHLNNAVDYFQDRLHIDRLAHTDIQVRKGSNWGSLTQEAVECLLRNKKWILKVTRFSVCADEIYKHTTLHRFHVPMGQEYLRLIMWDEGNHPKVITQQDIPELEKGWMFARKFNLDADEKVVDYVLEKVGVTE